MLIPFGNEGGNARLFLNSTNLPDPKQPALIFLLKVTLISTAPGGTSFRPDSGLVFTTTGGMDSMSCPRTPVDPKAKRARRAMIPTNGLLFMEFFGFWDFDDSTILRQLF